MAQNDKARTRSKRSAGIHIPRWRRGSAAVKWMADSELVREIVIAGTLAAAATLWRSGLVQRRLPEALR